MELTLLDPLNQQKEDTGFLVHIGSKMMVLSFPKLYRYILTMTCYFSKWVEAFPICDKSAQCVAQALYSAYCRHGAPDEVISDQGREFVNQVYTLWHAIVILTNEFSDQ